MKGVRICKKFVRSAPGPSAAEYAGGTLDFPARPILDSTAACSLRFSGPGLKLTGTDWLPRHWQ